MAFNRKYMTYISETLDLLATKLDDDREEYSQICFLVYKILSSIQKDLVKASPYWEFVKTPNNDEQWDYILRNEIQLLDSFGSGIKEVVMGIGASLSMRM